MHRYPLSLSLSLSIYIYIYIYIYNHWCILRRFFLNFIIFSMCVCECRFWIISFLSNFIIFRSWKRSSKSKVYLGVIFFLFSFTHTIYFSLFFSLSVCLSVSLSTHTHTKTHAPKQTYTLTLTHTYTLKHKYILISRIKNRLYLIWLLSIFDKCNRVVHWHFSPWSITFPFE